MERILKNMGVLEFVAKLIAVFIIIIIIATAGLVSVDALLGLYYGDVNIAIKDGLFVMLLLEMYYVINSFIKYARINISLVINVGAIAVIKEMVFQLESISLKTSISFATILISLGILYFIEMRHFTTKKELKEE